MYCTASPLPICVHFSQLSTRLHASSPASASSTTSPTPWSICTGYQSANASNSSCVLNSAARIVSNTRKFDRGLTHFRRSQLHWLDVVDRVRFRVCVQVFRCLHKMAPEYLSTYCQPVFGIFGRRHLRSADRGHLDFPRVKLASYGGRSFAYAGPSNWNSQ